VNKEKLKQYCNDGLSLSQISVKTGKHKTTIRYWIKKFSLTKIKSENKKKYKRLFKIDHMTDEFISNVEKDYYNFFSWDELKSKYKLSDGLLSKLFKLKIRKPTELEIKNRKEFLSQKRKLNPVKHSDEVKKRMSEKRIQFLKDNPDKHPWRSKNKFISGPCELIKKYLRELNVQFIEEFQPCLEINRFFSIDIAFPDKKIGIEINGFQHYEDDNCSLKPYYQKRHDILENLGWKIYEIHYSLCYNHNEISKILPQILSSEKKIEFDYTIFRHKEKKIKVSELDPNWRYRPRPSKQQLIDFINIRITKITTSLLLL